MGHNTFAQRHSTAHNVQAELLKMEQPSTFMLWLLL